MNLAKERPMAAELLQEATQTQLLATFHVKNTLCGIDAMKVQEVVRLSEVTPVHHAPKRIVGIINLRGRIVTVIDLGVALDVGTLERTDSSRAYIVEWNGEYVGLLADSASDVVPITADQVGPPPANIHGVQGRYFQGVCQNEDRLIAILNVDLVLGDQDNDR
jgi:purine-binding chemotaxis protein CheW